MFVFVKYQKINKNPKLACMLPSGFPTSSHFQPESRGEEPGRGYNQGGTWQMSGSVCSPWGYREVGRTTIRAVDSKLILRLLTSFFLRGGKSARSGAFLPGFWLSGFFFHRCQHMAL